ncbi:MAG: SDR family oxidoreductase [Alphaproteobacteria bacterium]|nr:SDR family oxidoreductase [Alphaproteobacteria bacterium]MBU1548540.1 SDR family oxidoreductase [Alphaproteobacteria bacterium]MBU2337736.1 SDR family oxidoreductase [Alphaproteobacteria bacterium]MBU2389873.1 SDR family oxidoreductase [Alphaproteobacteria bacterium]
MLSGSRAIVTGGANGIGCAIVFDLIARGVTVGALDVDAQRLQQMVGEAAKGMLVPITCDVSDRAAVVRAIDAFAADGGLDVLINNAVVFHYAELAVFPEETIDRMLDVGLKGTFWATQAATPHLEKSATASIVNLSSMAVSVAVSTASVYTSIKGALDALTRQQAAELGPKGIRVNAVAPGSVRTPGAEAIITAGGWAQRESKSLLGRLPEPEDVARAVAFLVSPDARCITGVSLKVDCGMSIKGA